MTVFDLLQAAYGRLKTSQEGLDKLAAATSVMIAETETQLRQARADLDEIAASLGYTVPDKPAASHADPLFTPHHG